MPDQCFRRGPHRTPATSMFRGSGAAWRFCSTGWWVGAVFTEGRSRSWVSTNKDRLGIRGGHCAARCAHIQAHREGAAVGLRARRAAHRAVHDRSGTCTDSRCAVMQMVAAFGWLAALSEPFHGGQVRSQPAVSRDRPEPVPAAMPPLPALPIEFCEALQVCVSAGGVGFCQRLQCRCGPVCAAVRPYAAQIRAAGCWIALADRRQTAGSTEESCLCGAAVLPSQPAYVGRNLKQTGSSSM